MRRSLAIGAVWAVLLGAGVGVGGADAVPLDVPYIAQLTYDSGAVYDGFVSVELALYATATPEEGVDVPLWGPVDYGDLYVASGILSTVIGGDTSPLDSATLDQDGVWLSVSLNGEAMTPLQRVLSVPYAVRAGDAEQLGGLGPEAYLTAPDLGDLGYKTEAALGDTFAPITTEADVTALQQSVAALTAELATVQGTLDTLEACCDAGPTGPCVGQPDGTACSDGDACTGPDSCLGGLCVNDPIDCDDSNDCTIDSCDSGAGCTYVDSTDPACLGVPGVEEIFSTRSHVNVARLDDEHLVVMWGIETDTSLPHTGFYAQVWRRSAGAWIKGTPYWVNHPILPVGSTNGLALAGGIGPQHALVMVTSNTGSTWQRDLLLLRRNNLDLTLVGTYPQTAAFFLGHPIDDTRYLIKYRYSNSGQPVHYRVVSRSGDSLSFGPELQRPSPGSFPSGAASSEPQTYDPLVRIGTNQFREIRGGYVWPVSKQSSFVLTVSGSNSLSSSGLITHTNSADKAMSALAVGNGTGGVAMLYDSYQNGAQAATLNGTSFAALGAIGGNTGTSIQAAGYESTDGFYGGRYWMRTRSGELYRFDALGSVPVEVTDGLPWSNCYSAPAILRIGNEAFFPVSTGSDPMELHTLNLDTLMP